MSFSGTPSATSWNLAWGGLSIWLKGARTCCKKFLRLLQPLVGQNIDQLAFAGQVCSLCSLVTSTSVWDKYCWNHHAWTSMSVTLEVTSWLVNKQQKMALEQLMIWWFEAWNVLAARKPLEKSKAPAQSLICHSQHESAFPDLFHGRRHFDTLDFGLYRSKQASFQHVPFCTVLVMQTKRFVWESSTTKYYPQVKLKPAKKGSKTASLLASMSDCLCHICKPCWNEIQSLCSYINSTIYSRWFEKQMKATWTVLVAAFSKAYFLPFSQDLGCPLLKKTETWKNKNAK